MLSSNINDNSDEEQKDGLLSVLADTENTPPVADLSYMVANQDTLLDGSFTTDTIIYWLWSNGTTLTIQGLLHRLFFPFRLHKHLRASMQS